MAEIERLAEAGYVDVLYGDESHVCSEGYVPSGWQFPGENVFVAAKKGFRLNCWGLFGRDNTCHWATTTRAIDSVFVRAHLDALSFTLTKPTVVVLDNASIHTAKIIQNQRAIWENRNMYLFFLPPYSPQLNIAEIFWRHLKGGWLQPADYREDDALAYAVNRCLANVGKSLTIKFRPFCKN